MRKLLIILALALLAGAGLYQFLATQHGYLVLSVGHYLVETTLWGALLSLLVLGLAVYLLGRLWRLLMLPRGWWRTRSGRRRLRVRDRTAQGVVDYLEGNWPQAIVNLKSGATRSEIPVVNYLGAAAANFNLGDYGQAEEWLRLAEKDGAADPLAVGLLRARMLLRNSDFGQALTLLNTLHRKAPGHPTLLRLLASARKGLQDWQGLEALLPDLKKHKAVSSSELSALEVEVHREILAAFGVPKPSHKSLTEQRADLDRLWDALPRRLQKEASLVAVYVAQLQKLGAADTAESRLRRFINGHWDDQLVLLYGEIDADPGTQLTAAEAWLRDHRDNPWLLEALGRLCMRSQLWGKGKEYFERALKLNPRPATWLELGELLLILQDTKGSNECFRKGLRQSVEKT